MSASASRAAINRRDFLRLGGAMGAAAAISTTLGACTGGPASTSTAGAGGDKDLVTAVIGYGNNQTWDPTMSASAFAMAGNNHIYEGLLDTDPITRAPYPALGTALPADVNATAWRFSLRAGAKWHDGQPVTVDDVLFTFERVLDAKVHSWVASNIFYKVPNTAAMAELDPALLKSYPALAMPPEQLLKGESVVDLGDAATAYTRIVTEVTAG